MGGGPRRCTGKEKTDAVRRLDLTGLRLVN